MLIISACRLYYCCHVAAHVWQVSAVRAIEAAKAKNSGQLKANMYDPLHRVATSLKLFFDNNERQPQHLRQPVTTKLIVAKVKIIRS
jgi:hypothetical protein